MITNIFLALSLAGTPFFGTIYVYKCCKADNTLDKLEYFIIVFLFYSFTIWSIFTIVDSKIEESNEKLITTTETTTTTETITIPTTITDDGGNIYVLQTTSLEG